MLVGIRVRRQQAKFKTDELTEVCKHEITAESLSFDLFIARCATLPWLHEH